MTILDGVATNAKDCEINSHHMMTLLQRNWDHHLTELFGHAHSSVFISSPYVTQDGIDVTKTPRCKRTECLGAFEKNLAKPIFSYAASGRELDSKRD